MNNFQQQPRETINTQVGLNAFLTRMFGWMGASVLVSALTAYLMVASNVRMSSGGMLIALIAWFILPFVISGQSMKRPTTAIVGLMIYAVLTGAVVSMYAYVYTGAAMAGAFVSSAAVFLTMATIGLTTKRDLSRIGTQATAALIGLIVAMIINMFLQNNMVALIFSFIAVIIFAALTAWDTQKMQKMYLQYGDQVSMTGLAINGALQLYLDFVNLFLQLLQIFGIFGGSRD
ncbi:Bax inhibitor-1/YccA family protein [Levilactobacillus zymae]|uniref:Bax inhibitor-1/YccA family protein n=1 Tax=Levilactobacillus zymae TaxID=267363 RepID=UPI0028B8A7B5|nr:Bax inhibitor-1/YccA family protein [Levilactobacillus zymae]MDT6980877.1 Bax inhibitor-1/YccA family protein [Levilactobacillus zymae]